MTLEKKSKTRNCAALGHKNSPRAYDGLSTPLESKNRNIIGREALRRTFNEKFRSFYLLFQCFSITPVRSL